MINQTPQRNRRRGIILIITLFFLVILGFMSVALFNMVPQELRQTLRSQNETQAHYVATSGIKHALSFMRSYGDTQNTVSSTWTPYPSNAFSVPSPNSAIAGVSTSGHTTFDYETVANPSSGDPLPSAFPYMMAPSSPTLVGGLVPSDDFSWYPNDINYLRLKANRLRFDNWAVNVTVWPDKWTWPGPWNPSASPSGPVASPYTQPKVAGYTIVALVWQDFDGNGLLNGTEKYALRSKCNVALNSLAKYAYFSSAWDPTVYFGLSTDKSRALVDGPFHTNSYPRFSAGAGSAYWSQTLGPGDKASFMGQVTFAGDGTADFTTVGNTTLKYDGIGWNQGNLGGASGDAFRPYTSNNVPIASAYNRLINGGDASIRQVKSIALPTDLSGLALNAWGGPNEQAAIASQYALAGDSVYVNHKVTSSNKAAGGIYIKGNVSQVDLQVLGPNGMPIGDDSAASLTPNATNDGNSAVRVKMSNRYVGGTGINTVSYTNTNSFLSNTNPTSSTKNYTMSGSAASFTPTSTNKAVSGNSFTGVVSWVNSYSVGGGSSAFSFSSTCPTSTMTSTAADVGGVLVTKSYSVGYNTPCFTGTTKSWGGTMTGTTKTSNGSQSYLASNTPVNYTATNSYLASTTPTSSTKSYTTTQSGASFTPTSTLKTNSVSFNPEALVVEINKTGMVLSGNASMSYAGSQKPMFWSTNASFSFAGDTSQYASLNLSNLNQVAVLQQDKTNPNLWIVRTMEMDKSVQVGGSFVSQLNGAVQIEGKVLGLKGWNKEKKTIGAMAPTTVSGVTQYLGQDVVINGHLRQFGTPSGQPVDMAGQYAYNHNLGILGGNFDVNIGNGSSWTNGANNTGFGGIAYKDLFIYAVALASNQSQTGSLTSSNWNTQMGWSGSRYRIRLFGGILQQKQTALTDGTQGWAQEYNYDPENATSPPPYFPVLNDYAVFGYLEDRP